MISFQAALVDKGLVLLADGVRACAALRCEQQHQSHLPPQGEVGQYGKEHCCEGVSCQQTPQKGVQGVIKDRITGESCNCFYDKNLHMN